jgi:hypothetical protein
VGLMLEILGRASGEVLRYLEVARARSWPCYVSYGLRAPWPEIFSLPSISRRNSSTTSKTALWALEIVEEILFPHNHQTPGHLGMCLTLNISLHKEPAINSNHFIRHISRLHHPHNRFRYLNRIT